MSQNKVITIQAAGSLKRYIDSDTMVHNVHTVGEAVTQLALPETGVMIMLVNGRIAYWHTELEDGDILKLVPTISGGRS